MFQKMLLSAALVISTLGFGLTPKASAGWFRHNAVERHQRLERNRYYGSGYSHSNNGYAYYGSGYSNGHRPNYNTHDNSYGYNGRPGFSNGHYTIRQPGHGSRH